MTETTTTEAQAVATTEWKPPTEAASEGCGNCHYPYETGHRSTPDGRIVCRNRPADEGTGDWGHHIPSAAGEGNNKGGDRCRTLAELAADIAAETRADGYRAGLAGEPITGFYGYTEDRQIWDEGWREGRAERAANPRLPQTERQIAAGYDWEADRQERKAAAAEQRGGTPPPQLREEAEENRRLADRWRQRADEDEGKRPPPPSGGGGGRREHPGDGCGCARPPADNEGQPEQVLTQPHNIIVIPEPSEPAEAEGEQYGTAAGQAAGMDAKEWELRAATELQARTEAAYKAGHEAGEAEDYEAQPPAGDGSVESNEERRAWFAGHRDGTAKLQTARNERIQPGGAFGAAFGGAPTARTAAQARMEAGRLAAQIRHGGLPELAAAGWELRREAAAEKKQYGRAGRMMRPADYPGWPVAEAAPNALEAAHEAHDKLAAPQHEWDEMETRLIAAYAAKASAEAVESRAVAALHHAQRAEDPQAQRHPLRWERQWRNGHGAGWLDEMDGAPAEAGDNGWNRGYRTGREDAAAEIWKRQHGRGGQ